ncbi:MAG: histidinol dehydrogenase [Myxococcaceae bacterium]
MTDAALRFRGELAALPDGARRALLERSGEGADAAVRARCTEIVARVRRDGDAALVEFAQTYDQVALTSLEIPLAEAQAALAALDPKVRQALERAARNVATAHAAFAPRAVEVETEPGVFVGRRPDPLARVGVYAPGGRAAYPSSVLMGAVPAKVAGVGEVVLCSPPGPNGKPSPVVLAAAALAQVDRIFAVGGAGAIAAMAYGTRSIPRVERIVGPGNAYVAEAKRQVVGDVAIDSPAGPSELLALVDASADLDAVAREMLAQAEHDPEAAVVAIGLPGVSLAQLEARLWAALAGQPRREVIESALGRRGAVLSAASVDEAVAFANAFAAEHLMVATKAPEALLPRLRNAGTVFLGVHSSVAYGDYLTGSNHVLPTGGRASAFSGLSTSDFLRWTSYQRVSPEAAARLADDVGVLAEAEGLFAHAAAGRAWRNAKSKAPEVSLPATRRAYADVARYQPPVPPSGAIDVSDNTNLFGAPPSAKEALARLAGETGETLTRYPPLYGARLKEALARRWNVRVSEVAVGCGSDDLIDCALRALVEPGERVAHPVPTFGMVPAFSTLNGLVPVGVPLRTSDWDIDVEALVQTGARLIYVCSPNNPTGTLVKRSSLERLLSRFSGVVVMDEAYAEFADQSFIDWAVQRPNLLVTRTFSKAFGLAGLRVGYALGPARLIQEVEKASGPYKVSAAAESCALAALSADAEWMAARAKEAVEVRDRLAQALSAQGLSPLPSAANFLCVPVPDAVAVAQRMQADKVWVRAFAALPGIGAALRIGVGPWPQMRAVLDALQRARE